MSFRPAVTREGPTDLQGAPASAEDVTALYEDVRVFLLASHFYWGTWALIEAALSSIDFGYLEYAYQRFDRYFAVKAELFPDSKP